MRCASVGVSIGASCVGSLRFLSVFASCSTAVAAEEKEREIEGEKEREKRIRRCIKHFTTVLLS